MRMSMRCSLTHSCRANSAPSRADPPMKTSGWMGSARPAALRKTFSAASSIHAAASDAVRLQHMASGNDMVRLQR